MKTRICFCIFSFTPVAIVGASFLLLAGNVGAVGEDTDVTLSAGALAITDANGGSTADTLTLSLQASNVRITDPTHTLGAGPGTTQVDPNTVDVPLASITAGITVNTLGGNDTLTLALAGGNFLGTNLVYSGGSQTSTPGDKIIITGGSQGTVTYNYTNANDGNIVMSNFGTVTYTGLEPITNSGTASDIIFNLPAVSNAATLADDGTASNTLSRLSGATFEATNFANPTGSVTINRGNAADTLVVNALPELTASLTLGADGGEFSTVTWNGAVTLASGKNLAAFATGTISLPNAASDLATSGAGTISLTTARDITLLANSSVAAVDGAITMNANQQAVASTGTFHGISILNAAVLANGTGTVTVNGRGGNGANNIGVFVRGLNGLIRGGTTAGGTTTTVFGRGGALSNPHGVQVGDSVSFGTITSLGGDVFVQGNAGAGTSAANYGVIPINFGIITSGGNGNVVIVGTGGTHSDGGNVGVFAHQGGTITSGGTGTISVTGTGGIGTESSGVVVLRNGIITSGGAGTVSVTGTAGGTAAGVQIRGLDNGSPGARISSGGGAITVTGNNGSGNVGIVLGPLNPNPEPEVGGLNTISSTGNAPITLIADRMSLDNGPSVVNSGSGLTTIRQSTNGRVITLGGPDANTQLVLSDSELDRVTSTTMQIGDANSGNVSVNAVITQSGKTTNVFTSTSTSVANFSSLGITGTVNSPLTMNAGGTLAPGTSPGIINSGNLTFASGSALAVEIGGTTPGNTASDHDQLNVTGTVGLNNATLTLAASGPFTPTAGQSFVILNNDSTDTIATTFSGRPEGATISNFLGSGLNATITYAGGTNANDVVISIPGPTVTMITANLPVNSASMFINGTGFSTTPANNLVVFSGGVTGTVTAATATQLTVSSLTGLVVGPLNASVTVNGVSTGAPVQVATVTPVVTMNTDPITSAAASLTINGFGFSSTLANNTIAFSSGAGNVTAATATSLTVTFTSAPSGGALTAVVTTNSQSSGAPVQVATVTLPTISIDSVMVNEGAGNAVFTVTQSAVSGLNTTFTYSTANGTAIAPGDYAGATNVAGSIPAGMTTAQISVPLADGSVFENSENFTVTLDNPVNATIATGTGTATIQDNDTAPTISINSVTVTEGVVGGNAVFTVTQSAISGANTTFTYSTADGTAVAPGDYTTATNVAGMIAAGGTTATISIPINDDSNNENAENFTVTLGNPNNATLATAVGTGTINDTAPTISINSVTVSEGVAGSNAVFTITQSAVSGTNTTFTYSTANGTAVAPGDYTTATNVAGMIAAGGTTATISIPIINDTLFEESETFTVTLGNPNNATLATGVGTGTIMDNDTAPTISINSVTVSEGVAGGNAVFTVTQSAVTGANTTFTYSTADGTAVAPGDYTTATNVAGMIAAGGTTATISIPINDDSIYENAETFTVTLGNPNNATLATGVGTGTITNNDTAPTISINSVTVSEAGGNAVFTVTQSAVSGTNTTFTYSTADGTAVAPGDYTTATNVAGMIAAGGTTATISIPIINNTIFEGSETFTVTLGNPNNATIATAAGTGTINDTAPTISIDSITVSEGVAGGNAVFTATQSAVSSLNTTFTYSTADGTAVAPGDYTAASNVAGMIAAGGTTATISIPIINDILSEGNEDFTVTLGNPVNATIATGTGIGTVTSDDAADVTVASGNLVITDVTPGANANAFTLSLNGANIRIHDPSRPVSAGSGTTQVNANTVEVPLASISGNIQVTTLAGNDTLTLSLAGGDFIPAGGLSFAGGDPTTGPGDKLAITGGSQGAVTYNYTNANSGNIVMSNFGTVTYTGLEPITNSGTASDIVFNLPAGPNAVTLGDDGTGGNTMSRLSGATFETTDFANPTGSVAINRGNAADTLAVNALPDLNSSLTIGAGATVFTTVTFNGAITLAANKSLAAFASGTISLPNTACDLATSGTGTISMTTARNISLVSGASLTTVDGALTLNANQQGVATTGTFEGIQLVDATVQATGTGVVTVNGRGGTVAAGNRGVFINTNSVIRGGTTAGVMTTDVLGTGGTGGSNPHGVDIENGSIVTSWGGDVRVRGNAGPGTNGNNYGVIPISSGTITSGGNGNVTIVGTGGTNSGGGNVGVFAHQGGIISSGGTGTVNVTGTGGAGTESSGVVVFRNGIITSAGSGTVSVTGTAGGTAAGVQLRGLDSGSPGARITSGGGAITVTGFNGSSNVGIVLGPLNPISNPENVGVNTISSTANAPITLIADLMSLDNGPSAVNSGSGLTTIRQSTNGRVIILGGPDVNTQLVLADSELDRVTAGTLNIGDANTGVVTVNAAITRPTATVVNVTSGANIDLTTGSLNSAGGNLTLLPATNVFPSISGVDVTTSATSTLGITSGKDLKIVITSATVDSGYTQLNVAGRVDVSGVNLALSGSGVPVAGQAYTIVNNDANDAITGTFAGLSEAAILPNFRGSGLNARISYVDGTGNDAVIRVLPTISIGNATVNEAGGNAVFTVTQSAISGIATTFQYSTANGTASAPGDYTAATSLTGSIPAGSTSTTISIPIINDVLYEAGNETFTVTLSNPVNASIVTATGTATIQENDPVPSISIGNVSVNENGGNAVFTVTQSAASVLNTTFTHSTADGPAVAPGDYTSATNVAGSITAGNTTTTISIPIIDHPLVETTETFTVTLATPANATIATATGTGTITDDDEAPLALPVSATTNQDQPKSITLSGFDGDGDSQTFSIVAGPAHGTLGAISVPSCSSGGCTATVLYTPATGYSGQDSFTYKTNDGFNDGAAETVSLIVRSSDASLSSLALSVGTIDPAFAPGTTGYNASVPNSASSMTVTPVTANVTATLTVQGTPSAPGSPSNPIGLVVGSNTINVVVTAADTTTSITYSITVIRQTHLESWRLQHFGTTANTGIGADTSDAEGDGLSNLLEFATGTDPNVSNIAPAVLVINATTMELTYPRALAALDGGFTFNVEFQDNLTQGSWSTAGVSQQLLPGGSGGVQFWRASVSMGSNGRRFLRMNVSPPTP